MMAPMIGPIQNSQSWPIYAPPANSAGPVLRAGLTEVLVTGIEMRWMRVRARPIGMPAKPAAAPFDVVPMMTKRKKNVITTSVRKQLPRPVFAGAEIAIAIGGETAGDPAGLARCDQPQYHGGDDGADHLGDDVGDDVLAGAAPGAPQADGDRRVEVAARDVTDGISHGQHGQAECKGNAEKADPEVRKAGSQYCGAATTQHQPKRAKELGDNAPGNIAVHRCPPTFTNQILTVENPLVQP